MTQTDDEYAKAMAVLNDLAADYLNWAAEDLKRLDAAYETAVSLTGSAREKAIRENVFRVAHDMKGQGATFDYELITDIGNHLCRYIERQDTFGTDEMTAIKVHIDALHRVLEGGLVDDGGLEGQALKAKVEAF